ncbi:MAG TPA: hypothetical protein PKI17_01775 [Syntrophomonas sp.]|nr:hypothetical protein [Syntrophomonas sp.]
MKKVLKKQLIKLSTGELASILAFWLCYFVAIKEHTVQVIYPLSVLSFILLQGSIYWFICLIRLTKKHITFKSAGRYYFVLKHINLLLILGFIPILIFCQSVSFKYYFWGIFLILFALIEFINYFLVRLSYPNPGIQISRIKTKSLRKSKLAKEIET